MATRGALLASASIACAAATVALFTLAPLDWNQAPHALPGMPPGALASSDVSAKFDDGFYDQIQGWIGAAGASAAAG